MSCCGKKRNQWLQSAVTGSQGNPVSQLEIEPIKAQNPKIFQYVGNGNLSVRGLITKQMYHFSTPNIELEVAFADSAAMMAEQDLRILSK